MIMIKGNKLCFPFGHLYVKVICHLKMRSVEQNLTKSLAKVKVTDGFQSLHSKRLSAVSGTINLETLLNICTFFWFIPLYLFITRFTKGSLASEVFLAVTDKFS